MKINILDLIDFEKVDTLLEGFNKTTGFVTAILDLNGKVLSKSGWRQLCTDFHRINPETSKKCTISDTELAGKLAEGEKYHFYKCLNGLVDVAVPIVINGEHIANLFSGQFFFEEPDRKFFIKQAEKYGFDKEKYIKALEIVPVVSKEKVLVAMDFLLNMTQLISEMTFQKLEQMELNSTIRESEEKFKSVFESANVGKSITLPTGEIDVNEAFSKMLGYNRDELQSKKWQDVTPEDEIPIIEKILATLLTGEKDTARFEKRYICKNGIHIWADVSVSIRRDKKGNPFHFITTIIDITERKQIEAALRETEQLKTKFFDNLNEAQQISMVGSWEWDLLTDVIWWSDETYHIFGVSRQNYVPSFEENGKFIHPEDSEKYRKQFEHSFKTGEPLDMDIRIIASGAVKICNAKGKILLDKSGKQVRFLGTIMDITERKKAEENIEKQNTYIKMILDNLPIGIATNEIDSMKVTYMNRKFSEIYGWPEDEFHYVGDFFEKVFPDIEYRQQMQTRILEDLASGDMERMNWDDLRITTKAGNQRTIHASNIPLINQNIMVSTVQDITERKHTEAEIRNQLDELQRWHTLTIGRESRIMEIKHEVNELLVRLGEPIRYPSQESSSIKKDRGEDEFGKIT